MMRFCADILGLWIENTEGAKFWMKVFNDLRSRCVDNILIAVTIILSAYSFCIGVSGHIWRARSTILWRTDTIVDVSPSHPTQ
jgi:Transposase, Mutator family